MLQFSIHECVARGWSTTTRESSSEGRRRRKGGGGGHKRDRNIIYGAEDKNIKRCRKEGNSPKVHCDEENNGNGYTCTLRLDYQCCRQWVLRNEKKKKRKGRKSKRRKYFLVLRAAGGWGYEIAEARSRQRILTSEISRDFVLREPDIIYY